MPYSRIEDAILAICFLTHFMNAATVGIRPGCDADLRNFVQTMVVYHNVPGTRENVCIKPRLCEGRELMKRAETNAVDLHGVRIDYRCV